jgi:hypothetical protein
MAANMLAAMEPVFLKICVFVVHKYIISSVGIRWYKKYLIFVTETIWLPILINAIV